MLCESNRYEVAFAKDGRETLASIADFRPNILITDWMLPDLSSPQFEGKTQVLS